MIMIQYMMNGYGWGMGWGWIIGLVILIVFVWLIIRVISGNTGNAGYTRKGSAMDILKERYARGEIDKKEFDEKKKDLQD